MITIQNLTYAYTGSKRKVFENFSLRMDGNRIYGLLGKNGTGKSTLLYLISGLLRPSKGSVITVDGSDSTRRSASLLEELFLVPEEFELPGVTLRQYVRLNGVFYPRFSESTFFSCLRDFEIDPKTNMRMLSMGQKKKVYMSFALATNTRLLLMDEPTNGLDIPSKALFRKVVAKNMSDDRTLIISTHQVHDIESLLDHVVIIDNNQVLLDDSVANLTKRYDFRTITHDETEKALYSEASIGGLAAILPHRNGTPETQINLELLFDAAINKSL